MTRWTWTTVACAIATTTLVGCQGDQNMSDKPVGGSSVMGEIQLAEDLAAWGRGHGHPVALAMAGRIMSTVSEEDVDIPADRREGGDGVGDPGPGDAPTADSLMEEARAMAAGDNDAVSAINSTARLGLATRGLVGGPGRDTDRADAYSTVYYELRFRGGELAEISVVGDGDTDLDLYVYDENGNLIAQDIDYTDRCYVNFTPAWTGWFEVQVVNLGRVWNQYTLRTN